MMTDRYAGTRGIQPASALAALGLSALMVSGLLLSSPAVQTRIYKTFEGSNIPLAQPTPEPTPETKPIVQVRTQPVPHARTPDVTDPVVKTDDSPFVAIPIPRGADGGTGLDPVRILPPLPTPTPAPVLTTPTIDARFARDFQPTYPASEQRAGREGLVTVRVLVGTDGRVRQIERVAAASEDFWTATERQALSKWRFRPATRDGVAVEAWRQMTVRFVMPE